MNLHFYEILSKIHHTYNKNKFEYQHIWVLKTEMFFIGTKENIWENNLESYRHNCQMNVRTILPR